MIIAYVHRRIRCENFTLIRILFSCDLRFWELELMTTMYRLPNNDEELEFQLFMENICVLPISTASESDIRKSEAYITSIIDIYKVGLHKFKQGTHQSDILSKINELEAVLQELKELRNY